MWGWAPGDPSRAKLDEYAQLDIERLVVCPPSMSRHDEATTVGRLDEFTSFIEDHAATTGMIECGDERSRADDRRGDPADRR